MGIGDVDSPDPVDQIAGREPCPIRNTVRLELDDQGAVALLQVVAVSAGGEDVGRGSVAEG